MTLGRAALITGGLACLFGLICQAPAALLNRPLSQTTGDRLQLAESRGTLWSGSARLVCRVGHSVAQVVGPCGALSWQLDGTAVASGRLLLRISGSRAGEQALIALSRTGWRIVQINLSLPAALLGSFDDKLATLGLGGKLHLEGQNITRNTGDLTVNWQQASTRLLPAVALGEHRLTFSSPPEGRKFVVTTLNGPLRLTGGGDLNDAGLVRLDIDVRVVASESRLTPLLAIMGQPAGPGRYRLRLPPT